MKFGKVSLAAAAIAAVAAPISGQAIAAERASQPVSSESELGGGTATIAVLFFLAAIIVGVLASEEDEPASP